MKRAFYVFGLILIPGLLSGCTGFAESMAGSVAGNATFLYIKKHLTNPVSSSQAYALPASRMVKAVNAVFRKRGYSVVVRDIEGEEPVKEIIAEDTEDYKSSGPKIMVVVRPLSISKSVVEVQVHFVRMGRSRKDDKSLSEKLLDEITQKVKWS